MTIKLNVWVNPATRETLIYVNGSMTAESEHLSATPFLVNHGGSLAWRVVASAPYRTTLQRAAITTSIRREVQALVGQSCTWREVIKYARDHAAK